MMVASYFVTSLASLNDRLKEIAKFSPLNYYQSGEAINGLKWEWLAGLAGAALFFALLGWVRFLRRDLRVSGEGS